MELIKPCTYRPNRVLLILNNKIYIQRISRVSEIVKTIEIQSFDCQHNIISQDSHGVSLRSEDSVHFKYENNARLLPATSGPWLGLGLPSAYFKLQNAINWQTILKTTKFFAILIPLLFVSTRTAVCFYFQTIPRRLLLLQQWVSYFVYLKVISLYR